ncbi:DNA repair ATPase [Pseudoalteromonas sp. GB56]
MSDNTTTEQPNNAIDKAVTDGGAYEVICARLQQQSSNLKDKVDELNNKRIDEFGQTQMEIIGRVRVRTENNCNARDIARVGDYLVFGYNVFIGLKKETSIADVFSLYRLEQSDEGYEIKEESLQNTFLDDTNFRQEFNELYTYYKDAKLIQLTTRNEKLFAVFQIGREVTDVRVFRWHIEKDGAAKYIDNRGERDLPEPNKHDFEWHKVGREHHVSGQHPHINILDTVFVETINGNFTIKVENNTEDGLGIFQEPVTEKNQSLADANIEFTQVGVLIILKVTPYKELETRYYVFNTRNHQVNRIDAIKDACIQLPEDHGIIFPGGYYLQNGETKSFPDNINGLKFKREIRSPNGEDVLYVFYEPEGGHIGLYSYNLIRKELQNPIYSHGYTLFDDGRAVIFNAEAQATRVHPMQVWQTPYFSQQHAAKTPTSQTFFSKIGNKELVRGIADLLGICRLINDPTPSRHLYEDLINDSKRLFDSYFWLQSEELNGLGEILKTITKTSELVIDEFEKVESIRAQATKALSNAQQQKQQLLAQIRPTDWHDPAQYINHLGELRKLRGHLITLKEQRYIDNDLLAQLDDAVLDAFNDLSEQTISFLSKEKALSPYLDKIDELEQNIATVEQVLSIKPIAEELEQQSSGLDLLSEILNSLKVEDATLRTAILDDISEIYGKLNKVRALARNRQKELGSSEAKAEFAAQFRLFSQSITNALGQADTPEKTDEQLSRLLVQLEELESKFGEFDEFLGDIMSKREELHEAFESRKQTLMDQRQKRASKLGDAAKRIVEGVTRRTNSFTDADQLNTYFASDPMVSKIAQLAQQLRELDDQVRADDIEAQLKAAKEQAIRSLRDKQDIYESGGAAIKLGKHRFSVNTQQLDLTLLAKDGKMLAHLIGTDYYEELDSAELVELKEFWEQDLKSENARVARFEYLAFQIMKDAEQGIGGLTLATLFNAIATTDAEEDLKKVVQTYASQRYQEGYEKGIHDADCIALLKGLLPVYKHAGLLRFSPISRALALLFWSKGCNQTKRKTQWQQQARSAQLLYETLGSSNGFTHLNELVSAEISVFYRDIGLEVTTADIKDAAHYLCEEITADCVKFVTSNKAQKLKDVLEKQLSKHSRTIDDIVDATGGLAQQWHLLESWVSALIEQAKLEGFAHYIPEVIALLLKNVNTEIQRSSANLDIELDNLLSDHDNIKQGKMVIHLDEYTQRLSTFCEHDVKGFEAYQRNRLNVIERTKSSLKLESFKPKPLSSFVRNRLIDEVYLPIIGDNLAKQMGTLGDNKRTDLMGLLLLISPPGYGKTTLMEYVADRLGLIFMKINCPSLGHEVTSIDPASAPNATARQELEKLNLGLEMGNNVMLYLDDIQHTDPEFLQKFISLCDGTRRIEGVWKGQSKTYDMRGKKFCVCMAGNPYTESGDVFKIPDMLANRADIYNLGDILGGKEEQFALSYIENALTSNEVLAKLALRDMQDVYKLVAMAKGQEVSASDLSYSYSTAEISEMVAVLKRLLEIQKVVLKINLQYIESAAQADEYRTEPPFKLQGSYRNMNKMAEKVSAVMDENELMQLIADHYIGEAQTLTSGAQENLLKLAQLRGRMTEQERLRWQDITAKYQRKQEVAGATDPAMLAVTQLSKLAASIDDIGKRFISNKSIDNN